MFNIKEVLGVGYYYGQKDFSINLDGTDCGLNVEIYAQHQSYLDHEYGYRLTTFSSGQVEVEGITHLFYTVKLNDAVLGAVYDISYTTPIFSHSNYDIMQFDQFDNLSIHGYANITFSVDSISQTYKIPMQLGIIIELDGNEVNYEWGNLRIWIFVIYLCSSVFPMTLLYRSIKRIRFEKWYTEEFEARDKQFFNFLSKKEKPEN